MGILPAETEVYFEQDDKGRWYLKKTRGRSKEASRFRRAHQAGKLRMNTEEIMALSRGD
jgi:hypothetical protein